jgi:glutathione synthase/RimK-type ligase-like ATP-grasp enzyme
MPKMKEYELLAREDFPFPKSKYISTLADLDDLDLNERFVIKPNKGGQGKDVFLVTAAACKDVVRSKFGESNLDLIAQKSINTGPKPTSYRVFSVLGEVIYCVKYESRTVDIEQSIAETNFAPVAANLTHDRIMELVNDQEIIELGERIHRQFPMIPVLGQDIVRDIDTQELYVLELNTSGWTWHLSSNFGIRFRKQFKLDYYGQFNALEKITRALARFTTAHAS